MKCGRWAFCPLKNPVKNWVFFSETQFHRDDVLLTRSVEGPGESIGIPVRPLGFKDRSFNSRQ